MQLSPSRYPRSHRQNPSAPSSLHHHQSSVLKFIFWLLSSSLLASQGLRLLCRSSHHLHRVVSAVVLIGIASLRPSLCCSRRRCFVPSNKISQGAFHRLFSVLCQALAESSHRLQQQPPATILTPDALIPLSSPESRRLAASVDCRSKPDSVKFETPLCRKRRCKFKHSLALVQGHLYHR